MKRFRKRFIVSIIITPPVVLLSPLVQQLLGLQFLDFPGSEIVLFLLSTIVFIYGGQPFFEGFFDEVQDRELGMMTLITVAISVAYLYSSAVVFILPGTLFFWELVTLIDVMLLGHWIEMRSILGASQALEELVKLLPSTAHIIRDDGSIHDVEASKLQRGDRVLIKPGERIPSDGEIVEGTSSINEAMVTGESQPIEKTEGDEVIGGTINGSGSLEVEISKVGDETYIAQVIDMVREAQQSKSRTQDLANRAAFILTIIALTAGSITLGGWLFAGQTLGFGIERAVTVMVITCPHALGLAVPLVVAVSTSISAKNGLLIRDRAAFERARNLQAVIFDKTGTLTKGEFTVNEIISLSSLNEADILQLAASIESHSEHSIAQGIVRGAEERDISLFDVDDFEAIPGKGARGIVEEEEIVVASPSYVRETNELPDDSRINEISKKGFTLAYVVREDEVIGLPYLPAYLIGHLRPEDIGIIGQMVIEHGGIPSSRHGIDYPAAGVTKQCLLRLGIFPYIIHHLLNGGTRRIRGVNRAYPGFHGRACQPHQGYAAHARQVGEKDGIKQKSGDRRAESRSGDGLDRLLSRPRAGPMGKVREKQVSRGTELKQVREIGDNRYRKQRRSAG